MTLADYLATLRRYLHDANDTLFPLADKTAYLNEAIQQRDLDSGGRRQVFTMALVVGTDTYTFTTIGSANIFDVVGVNLQYNGYRIVLEQRTYTEMNAETGYRAYLNTQDRPGAFCVYGSNSVIVGPIPSVAYTCEFDCLVFSSPTILVATTDSDALPFPYTYAVPMYAAYLAKLNERRYDEADTFLERYRAAVVNINAARTGLSPNPYGSRR